MTTQIEAFSRNRFDQSSAQAEFCFEKHFFIFSHYAPQRCFSKSGALLNAFLRIFEDYE